MTTDQIATLVILAVSMALLITERFPADLIALLIPVALGVSGVLTPGKALEGFGNPAVVTVAGMLVLSKALVASGAVAALGSVLQRIAGGGERRLLLAMTLVVASCSAFMNNTPVVVVFIPIILAIAKDAGHAPSRLLIPLSYVTILGGCCTLIGTSTTVLVASQVVERQRAPIAFFDPLPFGLLAVAVGALYLVVFGPRLLPVRQSVSSAAKDLPVEYVTEVTIARGSPLAGRSVTEAIEKAHPELVVLEVVRGQTALWDPRDTIILQADDVLLVRGKAQAVANLDAERGARVLPEAGSSVRTRDVTLVEVVIMATSPLVGRTVREAAARALKGANVMAVQRRGAHLRAGLADLTLRDGDTLLVQTEAAKLADLRNIEDFVLLEGLHEKLRLEKRAPLVLAIAAAVVLGASLDIVHVEIAFLALLAAVVLVLSGAITMRQAYRALDLPTLVLMGSTISLGVALEQSGLASLAADKVMTAAAHCPPDLRLHAALAGCYLLANVITAFASNTASAMLVLPIALGTADRLGASDRPFIMAVAFAASLDFSTPTGYQTNLLVYAPGGYRFVDYVRIGLPLNVLMFILAIVALPMLYPF